MSLVNSTRSLLSVARPSARTVPVVIPVRFRRNLPSRKPIWYPTAPSKLYDIPKKPVIPEEEQKWVDKMEIEYRNAFRSIHHYMNVNFFQLAEQGGLSQQEIEQEKQEQLRLIEENNAENQRVAEARKARWLEEQKKTNQEHLVEELQAHEQMFIEKEKAKEIITKEIERSKTYIKHDTLVDAIETAIDNPTSYEFAIDLQGKLVFEDKLHPYALQPGSVPETSSVTQEYCVFDDQDHYLEENSK